MSLVESAKWQGTSQELATAAKYFSMSPWQFLVILGIGVSGLLAFVNTYNAIFGVNKDLQACKQTGDLAKKLHVEFAILIIISILAIIFGLILSWLLRNSAKSYRTITWGIIIAGVFGIIYAISIKLSGTGLSNVIGVGLSWTVFIGFLIAGYLMSQKKPEIVTIKMKAD